VAVGGQGSGKTALLEALLGFRFAAGGAGTRRPVVVQAIHDPSAAEPRCRLQNEDDDGFGDPISPAEALGAAVEARAAAWLARAGGDGPPPAVHAKPIVVRAESASCPSLTVIDTPGLAPPAPPGAADPAPGDVAAMVTDLMRPKHRVILLLQEAPAEWSPSPWLGAVREVDPGLSRTVFVGTKLDLVAAAVGARPAGDPYLSAPGAGLPPHVPPFFVALPADPDAAPADRFRELVRRADAGLRPLLRGPGFDEARHGHAVGLASLRHFLEDGLAVRFQEAAPAVLAALAARVAGAEAECAAAEGRLRDAGDPARLRAAALAFAAALGREASRLLAGGAAGDPRGASDAGRTSAEELAEAAAGAAGGGWAGGGEFAGLRLHSRAAFERCLSELRSAPATLPPPRVPEEAVASALLCAGAGAGGGDPAAALARAEARAALAPVLETACARLEGVLRRTLPLALARLRGSAEEAEVRHLPGVRSAVRGAFEARVGELGRRARQHLAHQLELLAGDGAGPEGEALWGHAGARGGKENDGGRGAAEGEGAGREPLAETAGGRGKRGRPEGAGEAHAPRPAKQARGAAEVAEAARGAARAIQEAMLSRHAPATLRTCLLAPAMDGCGLVEALARPAACARDAEAAGVLGGGEAAAALGARAAELRARRDGLRRMAAEFEEVVGLL